MMRATFTPSQQRRPICLRARQQQAFAHLRAALTSSTKVHAIPDKFLQELLLHEADKKRHIIADENVHAGKNKPEAENVVDLEPHYVDADIEELADSYHLYLDVPGIKKSSAKVQIHPEMRMMEITWSRARATPTASDGSFQTVYRGKYERKMGDFRRRVTLARDCDPSTITAKLENGVLHVTASKKLPQRRIPISGV